DPDVLGGLEHPIQVLVFLEVERAVAVAVLVRGALTLRRQGESPIEVPILIDIIEQTVAVLVLEDIVSLVGIVILAGVVFTGLDDAVAVSSQIRTVVHGEDSILVGVRVERWAALEIVVEPSQRGV